MNWRDLDPVFAKARQRWGGNGSGSTILKTAKLVEQLIGIICEFNVQKMLDLGCGTYDWIWPVVDNYLGKDGYIGVDVVAEVIEENRDGYPSLRFELLDDSALPECDLVFCRDVMQHLTVVQNHELLKKIFFSAPRLLLASCYADSWNRNLKTAGGCRPINLEIHPYNLGKPDRFILEGDGRKRLGLWHCSG